MAQQWTEKGQTDPVDFLIIEPSFRDVVRGLYKFVTAMVRYRTLGGAESPWTLRQEIGFANTNRQLGPARVAQVEEWLSDELDFFEASDRPPIQPTHAPGIGWMGN
jgi:hypothetical protein